MPPRKSNVSAQGANTTADEDEHKPVGINIEDLSLPKSIVTRLAKGVLPPNTQISGDATLAMQKSATVFASHLAAIANEYAQSFSRKTISPADVLLALNDLEILHFRERLQAELSKYMELQTEKRNIQKERRSAKGAGDAEHSGEEGEDAEGRVSKKAKLRGNREANGKGKEKREKDADETESDEGMGDREGEEEVEEDGEDEEEDERLEVDEHDERELQIETEEREMEGDEALDNGEDSD